MIKNYIPRLRQGKPSVFLILKNEKMLENQVNSYEQDFSKVSQMIDEVKNKSWYQINSILISLYWDVGKYISDKAKEQGWGEKVVKDLSQFLQSRDSGTKGFSARNIWRMKKFYETYKDNEKLSTVLTVLPVEAKGVFKDSYVFEFAGLPEEHKENR